MPLNNPKGTLILGGTKGLGLSLAWEAHNRKIHPIIAGRSADNPKVRSSFPPDASYLKLDLADPRSINSISHLQLEPVDYIFWVAGIFSRKPFTYLDDNEMCQMIATHLSGPMKALRLFHSLAYLHKHPYHLVTIASTSSWRIRRNEALYCALKAAKATFTRNFATELVTDLPGSKVTLVNPGGMKTPNFWQESEQDTSNFMDPNVVAKVIWSEIDDRQSRLYEPSEFKEIQIMRNDDGTPNVSYGPRMPESPFE